MRFLLLAPWLFACNYVEYFEKGVDAKAQANAQLSKNQTFGMSLGRLAGDVDESALADVHSLLSSYVPAALRWDPDLYPRLLLLQYREEGITVARNIATLQGFRLLLGGAAQDFSTSIRPDFDATALLANITVGDSICRGLVAPSSSDHGDWVSILPAAPSAWETNLRFLAQRLSGRPSSEIGQSRIDGLKSILDDYTPSQNYTNESYIPVCTALNIDPEWVWL